MPDTRCLTSKELVAVYRRVRKQTSWLSDVIAQGVIKSEKSKIEFDEEETNAGLAPFVRPCDEGMATAGDGYFTKWFRPAYIKMKDAINVCDGRPAWYAGEREYSSLSSKQKFDLERARILQRHAKMLDIRLEHTVTKLAVNGSYNIQFQGASGENLRAVNMSYGRDPALTVAPVTLWNVATATPAADLQGWINLLTEKSMGVPFLCVMGRDVHMNLVQHEEWNDLNKAGARIRASKFDLNIPSYRPYNGASRVGSMGGIDYWTYTGMYTKQDGTRDFYIPPNALMIIAYDEDVPIMTKFFGAIQDLRSMRPVEQFSKEWEEHDPSAVQLKTDSAPLVGTLNPNLIVTATVLP